LAKSKSRTVVHVEWEDSCTTSGWRDDIRGTASCNSVGIVLRDSKHDLVLAQSWSDDPNVSEFGDLIAIPKSAVRRKTKLAGIRRKEHP